MATVNINNIKGDSGKCTTPCGLLLDVRDCPEDRQKQENEEDTCSSQTSGAKASPMLSATENLMREIFTDKWHDSIIVDAQSHGQQEQFRR